MDLAMITWKIRGTRPLLQSNPVVMQRRGTGTVRAPKNVQPAFDEAKERLYLTEDGKPYHPGVSFWKALLLALPNRIIGGKAASGIVPIAVHPVEDEFLLLDPGSLDKGKPKSLKATEWLVDVRRIVNKTAGGLPAARPKWKLWGGLLTFEVERGYFPDNKSLLILTELLNIGGRLGIGCGRIHKADGKSWSGIGNLGKFEAELKG